LTLEQRRLQQRLVPVQSVGLLATSVTVLAAGLAGIWGGWFYALLAVGGVVTVVVVIRVIALMRALRFTGPPFENLRWWWPRRSQLRRGGTAPK
jgi:uncharacterized protein involved in cysteine biosynthesis